MKLWKVFLLQFSVLSVVQAEPSNNSIHIEEAKAYCELFQLDFWQGMERDGLDAPEKINRFNSQFSENIKSPEFYDAVSGLLEQGHDPDKIYKYLQSNISALTGEPYDCPAIHFYYQELFKNRPAEPN